MLAASFISWWYGAGWKLITKNVSRQMDGVLSSFSVPTLLRTIFAPWKRIVTPPGSGIAEQVRAMGDNLISRLVGFTVRLSALIAATVCMALIAVIGVIEVVLWPLLPLLLPVCIILGLS